MASNHAACPAMPPSAAKYTEFPVMSEIGTPAAKMTSKTNHRWLAIPKANRQQRDRVE